MDVAASDVVTREVFGQLFGHPFGQGGDKDTLVAFYTNAYFVHEVVDLVLAGAYFNHRVEQAGGADDLFGEDPPAKFELEFCWCSADK